ncbi:hypothetical protein XELAEV_18013927mg [Xenopus laevis]|nr:hypothetical protein XELAEV_18013927mg [Xenopus laevis]
MCISKLLDTQKVCKVYSCPQCRAEFKEHPDLHRNWTLGSKAKSFLSNHPEQGGTGIFCTYCIESPVPAAKSCLLCEASLCETHLAAHSRSTEHVLTEPTNTPFNRLCSVHKEPLKYFCCNDATCICASCCLVGVHKGHKVETLGDSSEKEKEKLGHVLEQLIPKRDKTEKRIQRLVEQSRHVQEQSAGEANRVTALFRDIREQLESLEAKVLHNIFTQQVERSLQLCKLIKETEIKKEELSRKICHIKELCNMADALTFLQDLKLNELDFNDEEDGDGNKEDQAPSFFDGIVKPFSKMSRWYKTTDQENSMCSLSRMYENLITGTLLTGLTDIMESVQRRVNWQEATGMLLDINSAANDVAVSWDKKTASSSLRSQGRPKTPERFQLYQTLSSSNFSLGRHYWEVEVSESGYWRLGVAYSSIDREGDESWFGYNEKSWCLCREDKIYKVIHNSQQTNLHHKPTYLKIRISLDYEAQCLSFSEMSESIRHLHTFTASFTEPLHAAFGVGRRSRVTIIS